MSNVHPIKYRDFVKLLKRNGYALDRISGSHEVFVNNKGEHISISHHAEINAMLARRLIRENNLKQLLTYLYISGIMIIERRF